MLYTTLTMITNSPMSTPSLLIHFKKATLCLAGQIFSKITLKWLLSLSIFHPSRVAQWKRAGPITQGSVDRNHALLNLLDIQQC